MDKSLLSLGLSFLMWEVGEGLLLVISEASPLEVGDTRHHHTVSLLVTSS